jgi:hypothetical protein
MYYRRIGRKKRILFNVADENKLRKMEKDLPEKDGLLLKKISKYLKNESAIIIKDNNFYLIIHNQEIKLTQCKYYYTMPIKKTIAYVFPTKSCTVIIRPSKKLLYISSYKIDE